MFTRISSRTNERVKQFNNERIIREMFDTCFSFREKHRTLSSARSKAKRYSTSQQNITQHRAVKCNTTQFSTTQQQQQQRSPLLLVLEASVSPSNTLMYSLPRLAHCDELEWARAFSPQLTINSSHHNTQTNSATNLFWIFTAGRPSQILRRVREVLPIRDHSLHSRGTSFVT